MSNGQSTLAGYDVFMDNVIFLRRKHGLSKRKMAGLLGISVSSLDRLEQHEMPPGLRVDIFFRIYHHFGISPSVQLQKQLDK